MRKKPLKNGPQKIRPRALLQSQPVRETKGKTLPQMQHNEKGEL
jgi:hypothetical protein